MGNVLKVACWNVFDENEDCSRVLSFFEENDVDIYLFQELNAHQCDLIKETFQGRSFFANDYVNNGKMTFLAICVRLTVGRYYAGTINDNRLSNSLIGRRKRWAECLQFQVLGVECAKGEVSVVNLHLSSAVGPSTRSLELDNIWLQCDLGRKVIMGGDFNAFGRPWLNWMLFPFFGYSIRDLFCYEIRSLVQIMEKRGLRNAIKAITYPRFNLQMDFVFCRDLRVSCAFVKENRYGSDHRPIFLEFEL